jgi:dTDP-4-amino-4,6-dideoxygalactose transaminase
VAQAGSRSGRLLRYPVLCCDHFERDYLWSRLCAAGLGATAMYRRELPEIEGVAARVEVRGSIDGAGSFAGRLLTLPVHMGVTAAHLQRIAAVLSAARRQC